MIGRLEKYVPKAEQEEWKENIEKEKKGKVGNVRTKRRGEKVEGKYGQGTWKEIQSRNAIGITILSNKVCFYLFAYIITYFMYVPK